MSTESKSEGSGAETDGDQALWELLGRARPVEVSPYFARRVLRDLAARPGPSEVVGGWRAWLRPAWVLGGSTAVLAVAAGLFSFASMRVTPRHPMIQTQGVSTVTAVPARALPAAELAADVSPQDVEVIADLDNLVAREETNVWTDDTSRF